MARPSDHNKVGWIYFIESKSQDAVKIGFAQDVYIRLKSLQTGNPADLTLLCHLPATYGAELAVHRMLKEYNLRLEWYHDDGEIDALMNSLQGRVLERALQWLAERYEFCTDPGMIETARALQTLTEADVIEEIEAMCLAPHVLKGE